MALGGARRGDERIIYAAAIRSRTIFQLVFLRLMSLMKHRNLSLACLLAVGALVGFALYALINASVWRLIEDEARLTSERWARRLSQEITDFHEIAATGRLSDPDRAALRNAVVHGDVFRFKIFDAEGGLSLVSDALEPTVVDEPTLTEHNAIAAQVLASGRSHTAVSTGTPPRRPALYAETYLPVDVNGQRVAVIEVYADISGVLERHNAVIRDFTLMVLALALIGFGAPTIAFVRRSRELQRQRVIGNSTKALMAARDEAARMALRDPLTGLRNRRALTNSYESERDRGEQPLALLLFDIDHFKSINDGAGHDAGDAVLCELSEILKGAVSGRGVVGRLGGDEFLAIIRVGTVDDARRLAETIRAAVDTRPTLQRFSPAPTLSIGVLPSVGPAVAFSAALRKADLALYEAKRAGRNRAICYSEEMGARDRDEKHVLREVHGAMKAGEITPFYLPIVDLSDGRIIGLEALARWRHPERGLLTPEQFQPAFQDQVFAARITWAVIEQAFTDAAGFRARGRDVGRISINVVGEQLAQDGFAAALLERARRAGLGPDELCVELTEQALLSSRQDAVRESLEALTRQGVIIALDDFGSGFASLTHLRELPIRLLKLDLSIVRGLDDDAVTRAVAGSIVGLAHSLGIEVIAEGVENAHVERILREIRCDAAQGFRYARALPADAIEVTLRDGLAVSRSAEAVA